MGFLSATSTIVRLHATPPKNIDRLAIARAVSDGAFRDQDELGIPKAEASGWVAIHDPMVTELDPTDLFFQQYLVVGFRFDVRAFPAKLAWIERRRAEAARKAEQNLERIGRNLRREIKEDVESSLLARALPNPKLFECAWNLETEVVYFTGKLKSAREAFTKLFRETFGVTPTPMIPYLAVERVGLADRVVDQLRAVEPSRLVPAAAPRGNGDDAESHHAELS
jgi:DNA recombination-dependent growth factor C